MPPRSPLPPRHGLTAAWMRTPDRDPANPEPWPTMQAWLHARMHEFVDVAAWLAARRFVYGAGEPVGADDPYVSNTFVWFHRDLSDEAVVPGETHVVHRDERLVVVDKPAFLSTIRTSTPRRLRFSMLARPSGDRSQVEEVTHSGFRPSCSMRTTW